MVAVMGDELTEPQDDEKRLPQKIQRRLARIRNELRSVEAENTQLRTDIKILTHPDEVTDADVSTNVQLTLPTSGKTLHLPVGTVVDLVAGDTGFQVGVVEDELLIMSDNPVLVRLEASRYDVRLFGERR